MPAVDELCRVGGHVCNAYGELALRRRLKTREIGMTSGRGCPRSAEECAVARKTSHPFSTLRVCTPALMLSSVLTFSFRTPQPEGCITKSLFL